MRLIDADALYNSFGASGNCGSCQRDAYKCQYYNEHTLMEFCERIDDAPTVDAVEVVRCKDCYYCAQEKSFGNINYYCDAFAEHAEGDLIGVSLEVKPNHFCAWGERRKDADS